MGFTQKFTESKKHSYEKNTLIFIRYLFFGKFCKNKYIYLNSLNAQKKSKES